MTRLRVGVVGCGGIAPFHLRGWRRIREVEVVGFADVDLRVAEQRRDEFSPFARAYRGLDEMLDAERLDIVDILTPPDAHVEQCRTAARAGVHIVCQKPLAPRLEDAEALVAGLAGSPRAFVVHENHRLRPWFVDAVARCRAGELGAVRYLRFEQHDAYEPPERFKGEHGVLLEYGVHFVDMMRALLGEPVRVRARTERVNPRVAADSLAHVVFEYPAALAAIEISWRAAGVHHGSALVLGEAGDVAWQGRLTRGVEGRYRVVHGSRIVCDEARTPTAEYEESFYAFERALVDAILAGTPPPQGAADNLRTLRLTFAAIDAARSGRTVALDASSS